MLLITNTAQVDHVIQVLDKDGKGEPFRAALTKMVVASIGPPPGNASVTTTGRSMLSRRTRRWASWSKNSANRRPDSFRQSVQNNCRQPIFSPEHKPFILATITERMPIVVKAYIDQGQNRNQERNL